jgi:hypothetical protein
VLGLAGPKPPVLVAMLQAQTGITDKLGV